VKKQHNIGNTGAATGLGSVGISLLIGVLVPLFFSLALLFIRKQIFVKYLPLLPRDQFRLLLLGV
jgi:hypothetical protein